MKKTVRAIALLLLVLLTASGIAAAATAIEYGLIAALIAIAIIVAVGAVGTSLCTTFDEVQTGGEMGYPGGSGICIVPREAPAAARAGEPQLGPGLEIGRSDGVADYAQAIWIAAIANGNTDLTPAQQATVLGDAVAGTGYLGNRAALTDPAVVSQVASVFETDGGYAPAAAEYLATQFLELMSYFFSIDHEDWLAEFEGTNLESIFDGLTLNSDARAVIGGDANPDLDLLTNDQEFENVFLLEGPGQTGMLAFIAAAEDPGAGMDPFAVPMVDPLYFTAALGVVAIAFVKKFRRLFGEEA